MDPQHCKKPLNISKNGFFETETKRPSFYPQPNYNFPTGKLNPKVIFDPLVMDSVADP
jgi:hypothetical protein